MTVEDLFDLLDVDAAVAGERDPTDRPCLGGLAARLEECEQRDRAPAAQPQLLRLKPLRVIDEMHGWTSPQSMPEDRRSSEARAGIMARIEQFASAVASAFRRK